MTQRSTISQRKAQASAGRQAKSARPLKQAAASGSLPAATSGNAPEMHVLTSVAEARLLLKPLRLELMRLLAEERTLSQLAELLGISAQKAHYHVKLLERAGFVIKLRENRVRALAEGVYRASAGSYWLSPQLTARLGGRDSVSRQISLGYMLNLAEDLLSDLDALARAGRDVPTLSLAAQVELADPKLRQRFMRDVERAVKRIAERYGAQGETAGGAETYKLVLACYQRPAPQEQAPSEN